MLERAPAGLRSGREQPACVRSYLAVVVTLNARQSAGLRETLCGASLSVNRNA